MRCRRESRFIAQLRHACYAAWNRERALARAIFRIAARWPFQKVQPNVYRDAETRASTPNLAVRDGDHDIRTATRPTGTSSNAPIAANLIHRQNGTSAASNTAINAPFVGVSISMRPAPVW
jgi:hypothetical protein